jgi:DNA-binding NarL/FixJ family response regulator
LVVASATARPREVFELKSLGATAFLEKPLDGGELAGAIQQLALRRERVTLHGRRRPRIGGYAVEVSHKYGLTPAETEVLECVLQRMTYEEVASHRHVSRNTVKSQMRVILEKCGASSLREIARDGLEPPSRPAL